MGLCLLATKAHSMPLAGLPSQGPKPGLLSQEDRGISAPLLSPAEREGSISQHMPDPPEHGCRQPVPNHLCPWCLEEAQPVPVKKDHVSLEHWPRWDCGSFSAEGIGHQGLVAPGRRGRRPGTFGTISFWTASCAPEGHIISVPGPTLLDSCKRALANLLAASGLHGGGAGPLNKWGSLHNTGDSDWGPPTQHPGPLQGPISWS